jgi:hypothetical protein
MLQILQARTGTNSDLEFQLPACTEVLFEMLVIVLQLNKLSFHHRSHNGSILDPILGRRNLVHTFKLNFFKIHFNIMPLSSLMAGQSRTVV